MSLQHLFQRPLRPVPSSLAIFVLVVALLGFADATYLTVEHFTNAVPPCSIGSCETVLTSAYATVAGIPLALIGSVYYLVVLVCVFAYLDSKKTQVLQFGLVLTVLGFVASLVLVGLQAFVIHAFCLYCMGSATTSTILGITSLVILKKYRSEPPSLQPEIRM